MGCRNFVLRAKLEPPFGNHRLQTLLEVQCLPRRPSHTKNTTESEFSMRSKCTTAVSKQYRECSEMLVFPKKKKKETVQIVKSTAATKYYGFERRSIFSTEGSFGHSSGDLLLTLAGTDVHPLGRPHSADKKFVRARGPQNWNPEVFEQTRCSRILHVAFPQNNRELVKTEVFEKRVFEQTTPFKRTKWKGHFPWTTVW